MADTEFDGTTMTIRHTPKDDAAWFAYFPPYPAYRMEDKLLALSEFQEEVDVFFFGRSVLGQKLIMIRIGNDCNGRLGMRAPAHMHTLPVSTQTSLRCGCWQGRQQLTPKVVLLMPQHGCCNHRDTFPTQGRGL